MLVYSDLQGGTCPEGHSLHLVAEGEERGWSCDLCGCSKVDKTHRSNMIPRTQVLEVCGGVARTGGGGGKVPVTSMSAPPVWPSTRWVHDGCMV